VKRGCTERPRNAEAAVTGFASASTCISRPCEVNLITAQHRVSSVRIEFNLLPIEPVELASSTKQLDAPNISFFSSYTNSGYTMGTSPPYKGQRLHGWASSQWSLRRINYISSPVIMRPSGLLVWDRGASLRADRWRRRGARCGYVCLRTL
jgi:hypothetical protein